jgi:hypothetical protein
MAGATETSASGWKVADKGWERVQVKTFTNWVNSQLRWRELKVADLSQDLHDGVMLSELLEQISGKVVPHKKEVKATDRHKKIDNLQNAVKFVAEFYKEAGVKITTSAEDLVDCKSGAILGMVWVIIHKFAVSGINEGSASAKEGLLLWAQRNTQVPTHDNCNDNNRSINSFSRRATPASKSTTFPPLGRTASPSAPSSTTSTTPCSTSLPSRRTSPPRTSSLPSPSPRKCSTSRACLTPRTCATSPAPTKRAS